MSSGQGCSDSGSYGVENSPKPDSGKLARFRAEDCLLGVVEKARDLGHPVHLAVADAGWVTVDFDNECFVPEVALESDFFRAPPEQVEVSTGSEPNPNKARPLSELLWKSAYYGSAGALLDGYHVYDVVELECWPNLTRIPHARSCLPLCSLLARRPSSISFAHRMLRVPQADALRFYSAARAAGYLRLVSAQPGRSETGQGSPAKQTDETGSDSSRFWSRLFSRFSGL